MLPRRVMEKIAASRRESQILVGWVQLGIVALFAALYAASPKTFMADVPFAPIPWVLGFYTVFTVARLAFAYRGELAPWVLVLSALLDVAILLVAIWSFHLQYGQPAAFYLKAPTLLYVFIFIALRALSYNPTYVLVSGFAAAAGWVLLAGYAIHEQGGMARITRDYVEYMNGARVLVGAEIDKVISIVVVTLVLAYSVWRSRRLLESAVAEQAAAATLSRFLPPEVASSLRAADDVPHLGEGVEREAAAMFIDLRGFTKLAAELSPQALIAVLGEYQRLAVPIVHRHRGTITTFLGDGIMVAFGAIQPSPTYAADALRCADELLSAFADWTRRREAAGAAPLGVGIGVDCGTVVCGPIGDEQRLEYAVIGDAVNRAAKLQNHTKVEQVRALASAAVLAAAVAQGYRPSPAFEARPARVVAGVAGTFDVVVIA